MTKTVSFGAFLRGAGKSNIVANVAVLLALAGHGVGVVDLDEAAPAQAHLFRATPATERTTLTDALIGRAGVKDAAYDVTPNPIGASGALGSRGRIVLLPLAFRPARLPQVARSGLDADQLARMLDDFARDYSLDSLLIDTSAGLDELSLSALAISDAAAHVLALDRRNYQGAAVTLDLARRLGVPRIGLVASLVPSDLAPEFVSHQFAETYGYPVVAVLPHLDEMAALGSASIFALTYPQHPFTAELRRLVEWLQR